MTRTLTAVARARCPTVPQDLPPIVWPAALSTWSRSPRFEFATLVVIPFDNPRAISVKVDIRIAYGRLSRFQFAANLSYRDRRQSTPKVMFPVEQYQRSILT